MLFNRKKNNRTIVACSIFLVSISALADDGLTPGPGIFTGKAGEYSLLRLFNPSSSDANHEEGIQNDQEIKVLGYTSNVNQAQIDDYEIYQEWRVLQAAKPELYNDFQLYLDYKTFLKTQNKN